MRVLRTYVALLALCGSTVGSAQTGLPAFEVASIKRSDPDARGSGSISGPAASGFTARNMSVQRLILYAYALPDYQLADGPDWTRDARFDIVARYADGAKAVERRFMVQHLLAERFQLKTHSELRSLQGHELRRARTGDALGPRLQAAHFDCDAYIAAGGRLVGPDGTPVCTASMGDGTVRGWGRPLALLAALLSRGLQTPVRDATGLVGNFDFELDWSSGPLTASEPRPDTDDKPSIFTAVQEQLGLRLDTVRIDLQVLVIDHIEQPSEN